MGSSFLELVSKDSDDDPETLIMGIDHNNQSIDSENMNLSHSGKITLKNVTEGTIVAYYLYTSHEKTKAQKYKIYPKFGLLEPSESAKVNIKYFESSDS